MRRIMFTAVASLAILAIAPASVLAKHHSKRHQSRTHHGRAHRARVRHERFGVITALSSSSSGTTTTTTPGSDTAGTVNTFDGTTLVIKLTDGTLVSGKVGPNTEMECQAAETDDANDAMHADGDQGGGGDQNTSGGDQNTSGGGDENTSGGGEENGTVGESQGDDNNDQGDDTGAPTPSCTSANLVTGAVVGGAELGISSAGATWDKVELVG